MKTAAILIGEQEEQTMCKSGREKWASVVGRMLLAYALVFAPGTWAGQNQGAMDKAGSPQKAAARQAKEKQSAVSASSKAQSKQTRGEESENAGEEKPSGDASHQGIKVHGHWTIEVRNPDGALVTRREFENSLVKASGAFPADGGDFVLVNVLGRAETTGPWSVKLRGSGLCQATAGSCVIGEISNPIINPDSVNLKVMPSNQGTIPPTLTLSGTVMVSSSGTVASVETFNLTCPNIITPSNCPGAVSGGLGSGFTSALVTPSVDVVAGQTIAVTVVISFS